jgi:membrane protein DedA with SNARE-associated domain
MVLPDTLNALPAIGLLAAATFASEDLTCIAAGALVAEGQLTLGAAIAGCFSGIVTGDFVVFLAGRVFASRVLATRFVKHLATPEAIDRSSRWLATRGQVVVFLTRFVPGTRVATSLAAGALRVNPLSFAAWITAAAAVWTPLLVGVSSIIGAESAKAGLLTEQWVAGVLVSLVLTLALSRALHRRFDWRTRRKLYGFWRRTVRWEFWPAWIFYPPVVAYVAWLMTKHRSVTLFTAANPGIEGGGFIGESKFDILKALSPSGMAARAALVRGDLKHSQRISAALAFMEAAHLEFPIVVKPDQGQRGSGVVIVRTMRELEHHLAAAPLDLIVQEYVPGDEFGVFYIRHPSERRGRIFSITEKQFPFVTGDGRHSLEELILADDRAVCLRAAYGRIHAASLEDVPRAGARIQLVEIGSHCRGSRFVDRTTAATPAMVDAFDRIAQRFDGFFFGRFDVRVPSINDLRNGVNFKILELNGVTSEATHIYDAGNSVWTAWRILCRQWRIAFEIGDENRRRGHELTGLSALLASAVAYRRIARQHPQAVASKADRSNTWRPGDRARNLSAA